MTAVHGLACFFSGCLTIRVLKGGRRWVPTLCAAAADELLTTIVTLIEEGEVIKMSIVSGNVHLASSSRILITCIFASGGAKKVAALPSVYPSTKTFVAVLYALQSRNYLQFAIHGATCASFGREETQHSYGQQSYHYIGSQVNRTHASIPQSRATTRLETYPCMGEEAVIALLTWKDCFAQDLEAY